MIDITTGEPEVILSRQEMQKKFDIDVEINGEVHNLEINIFHTEDVDGSDTELDKITMSDFTFVISAGTRDVAEELHDHLDLWFNNKFRHFMLEETKEDFDNIYNTVWEYIEEKDLS